MKQEYYNRKHTPFFSQIALAFLLMLQCIVPQAVADDAHKIQLIKLQHRSAIEVLDTIKPHLPQGTKASQKDQNLVISGKQSDLEQLKILIHALDQPVQGWRVFFAQGQLNLEKLQLKHTRHYSTARSDIVELVVREGAPARLERGFWIPTQSNNKGVIETGYEWLASGLWVAVKPVGNAFVLNLSTQKIQPKQQTFNQKPSFSGQQFEGEVALQLGRWVTLGSEAQLAAQTPSNSRHYSGGNTNEYYSICIESIHQASCPR